MQLHFPVGLFAFVYERLNTRSIFVKVFAFVVNIITA